jgi:hypothetical protein
MTVGLNYSLGDLLARIGDDLARNDLSVQIANAVTDAVTFFMSDRFYWNEIGAIQAATPINGVSQQVIHTVAGQYLYTKADLAAIPDLFKIDDIFVTINNSRAIPMSREDFDLLLELISTVVTQGYPFSYAWGNQGLLLYPIPNNVYPVSILGGIKLAAPSDPTDSTNVWISEAFGLLRAYAKGLLYTHTIRDPDAAAMMWGGPGELHLGGEVGAELAKLQRETSSKRAIGRVMPTQF